MAQFAKKSRRRIQSTHRRQKRLQPPAGKKGSKMAKAAKNRKSRTVARRKTSRRKSKKHAQRHAMYPGRTRRNHRESGRTDHGSRRRTGVRHATRQMLDAQLVRTTSTRNGRRRREHRHRAGGHLGAGTLADPQRTRRPYRRHGASIDRIGPTTIPHHIVSLSGSRKTRTHTPNWNHPPGYSHAPQSAEPGRKHVCVPDPITDAPLKAVLAKYPQAGSRPASGGQNRRAARWEQSTRQLTPPHRERNAAEQSAFRAGFNS